MLSGPRVEQKAELKNTASDEKKPTSLCLPQLPSDVLAHLLGFVDESAKAHAFLLLNKGNATLLKSQQPSHKKAVGRLMAISYLPPELRKDIPPAKLSELVEVSTLIHSFIHSNSSNSYVHIFEKITSFFTPPKEKKLLTFYNVTYHFISKQLREELNRDDLTALADPLVKASYQLACLEEMPRWTNQLATNKNYRLVELILEEINDQSSDQAIRTALGKMEGLIMADRTRPVFELFLLMDILELGYKKLGAAELDKIRQLKNNLPLNKNKVIAALNEVFVAKSCANWNGYNVFIDRTNMASKSIELMKEALISALLENPKLAKKALSLPIFKSLLPDYQTQTRPEKSMFAKISASLGWGLISAAITIIITPFYFFNIYLVTGWRLLRTPLEAFYNFLFNQKALLPSLKTDLKELGKALASTVLSPLLIFNPLLGLIKGLIGGFYYGSLKNGRAIWDYYFSSRLSPKTIADEIEIYDRQCQQNSSTAEIGGSLGEFAMETETRPEVEEKPSSILAQSIPSATKARPHPLPNAAPASCKP